MSDYCNSVEQCIAAVPAPTFDFATVQRKAALQKRRFPRQRSVMRAILLVVAVPLVVSAAVAVHFVQLQVTHRFGNWQLYGPTETLLHPKAAAFLRLESRAPYQVVWPSGLPDQDKPFILVSVGSEVFIVGYSCSGQTIERASSMAAIIPKNHSAVSANLSNWFASQLRAHRQNLLWDARAESVLLASDCLSEHQMERVRAMTISAAAASR
jgi:hypothetical protein